MEKLDQLQEDETLEIDRAQKIKFVNTPCSIALSF